MPNDEGDLCGIPGTSDSPLTKGEFNKLITQVRYYHLRPLREDFKELKHMIVEQDRTMEAHIKTDKEFFDKLTGVKWALYAIFGCMAFLVPLIWQLIKALNLANVL